ncbi:hypothetical protein THOM_1145, partial [Trachipleistophora hominis]
VGVSYRDIISSQNCCFIIFRCSPCSFTRREEMTSNNTNRNNAGIEKRCDRQAQNVTRSTGHPATTSYIIRDKNLRIRTRTCQSNKHLMVRINKRVEDALVVMRRILERNAYDTVYLMIKYGSIQRMDRSTLKMVYDTMGYVVYVGYMPGKMVKEDEYVCLYRMERIKSL